LTQTEKDAVKKAIEDANPGKVANVVVGNDGAATVTFKDGSEATLTPDKTVEKAKDAAGIKDPAKTPVQDPANLTQTEKD
ncbi:KxYKxGKxW signal protein, partial [human gut metagenome]